MKVLFYPSDYSTNKYGSIITEGLKTKGIQLVTYNDSFKSYQSFKSIDVIHLNWFESLGKSPSANLRKFLARAAKLIAFKASGKRIVWTMHNKMAHDQKNMWLKKVFMRLIVQIADVIIVHSKVSEQILLSEYNLNNQKIKYIPHPDYIGSYKTAPDTIAQPQHRDKLKLLFLGAVKPYKNIELLIDTVKPFQEEIILTIAGKAKKSYREYITEYTRGLKNIHLVLEFIPDDLLTTFIGKCDLLILPYNLESSLNSGTVILAFSNAKTVICPEIGTISDLQDKDIVLSYTYSSATEHAQILAKRIQKAIDMKKENPNIFNELGEKVFKAVSLQNSKDTVIENIIHEYHKV